MNFVRIAYPSLIALDLVAALTGFLAVRQPKAIRAARVLAALALAATAATWIARWIEVAHLPLFGTYENALSVALAVTFAGVLWDEKRKDVLAAPGTLLVAALLLSQGVQYDAMAYGLTISERSLVVDIHAVLAWLALAVFAVNAALAVRVAFAGEGSPLDKHLEWLLTLGFVFHTAMIVTGSLYKFLLFGKVWSWDPIETMALISWLAYGTLLHMSLLAGWSGRRFARWCIATFVILFVSYRAIVYFPSFATYHIFDIGLKLHLG